MIHDDLTKLEPDSKAARGCALAIALGFLGFILAITASWVLVVAAACKTLWG